MSHSTKGCECRTPVCDSHSNLSSRNERSRGYYETTKQAEIAGHCRDFLFRFQVSDLNSSSEEMASCATVFRVHVLLTNGLASEFVQPRSLL